MGKKRFLQEAYRDRTTEQIEEFYNRWSSVYDEELAENNYRQPERCASTLRMHMNDHSGRVLDVGCGTGLSGIALARAGYSHIDGCDLSAGMIEKAFETGVYTKLFTADLNRPPLDCPDNEYDAITAVGVFSYGHVMAEALNEFIRISRQGAPIIIGLNDHYFQEGKVTEKLDMLAQAGQIEKISQEHGEHIPGTGLTGWVIVARKRS